MSNISICIQMTTGENGAAALSMMLSHFGRYVPMQELREVCVTSRNGSSPEQIRSAAEHYGLEAKLVKLDFSELKGQKLPLLIQWKKRYYAIIKRFAGSGLAVIVDPAKGEYKIPIEKLKKNFTGTAILLSKGPDFQPGGTKESLFTLLESRLKLLVKPMILLGICSVIAIWLDMTVSKGQKFLMDNVVSETSDKAEMSGFFSIFAGETVSRSQAAMIVLFVMYILITLDMIVSILKDETTTRASRRLLALTGSDLFKKLFSQPLRFFEQYSSSEIMSRLSGNSRVVNTLVNSLVPRIINAVMLVFYFFLLFSYNRILALICVGIEAVNCVIVVFLNERNAIISRAMATSANQLNASVLNGINMIDTIKSTGSEKSFYSMWYKSQQQVNESRVSGFRLSRLITLVNNVHSYLVSGIQLFLGAWFVSRGQFTIGTMALFNSVLGNMRNAMSSVLSSVNTMQTMRTNIERVVDVERRPGREDIPLEDGVDYDKLKGHIEVKHVNYRYNKGDDLAISDVSLEVKPGQMVAIVGGTGCGKSTLLKVMADLYEAESGEVLYSGKKRSEIPDVVFHSSVMTVDQECVVFEDSVYSNIRMWDDTIEDYEIYLAARDAQIHKRILRDRDGYGTIMQENGRNFSGGELQRMELARALAHEPTLLFLDEFTSALDALTESRVIKSIRDKGTTCVIVAHRLSTIVDCDRIYVMDKGKIVQEGTHSELYAQEGLYRTLIGSQ